MCTCTPSQVLSDIRGENVKGLQKVDAKSMG